MYSFKNELFIILKQIFSNFIFPLSHATCCLACQYKGLAPFLRQSEADLIVAASFGANKGTALHFL